MTVQKNDYPKAPNTLVHGALLTYIAGLLLLIAFCSPYWVQSFHDTYSSFKHMGLWEYCFDSFRYPYYQFDHLFNGCHHIFSQEYYVIREWLLPPWLMFVQAFVTIGFLLSFGSQILMALQLCRWPLEFVLQYEWILTAIDFICTAITSVLLFLAVAVFGGSHFRRDWLMYPNWNYLSWSYGLAVISFFFHGFAALLLYRAAKQSYEKRREARNLIMQMHPEQQSTW
ncbi:uncharacterized protein LOC108733732 [Agrilus planipennis]|uniref:Uncharacterized protein LOC108733732 n=1 Tax=Agrilus planipennis TaxID=224129 RepID=A0A1W4WKG3_AGRPL|nr:uncharacterized protein LOC108733732 [Agrilus planipennis]